MSGRRPTLRRRLLKGTIDVVSDRAPGLSGQLHRALAAPLQRLDPEGAARTAEARLDNVCDRAAGMAARGAGPSELVRIERDFTRTREDLERVRWAALVGYARVHTGVHYPSDVVAGSLVGAMCGWTVRRLAARLAAAARSTGTGHVTAG